MPARSAHIFIFAAAMIWLVAASAARGADVPPAAHPGSPLRLNRYFSDSAVVQRDRPIPVRGWAAAGEAVTVLLGGSTARTTAGPDGRWAVELAARPASAKPIELTVTGATAVVRVRNLLVGDVFLCSGQSNMSIGLGHFTDEPNKKAAATADFPLVRQFGVVEHFAAAPQDDVAAGEWLACSPKTAPRFSAVAFYFARRVHADTGVPIGIVRSAKGSTRVEMWLSQATLLTAPPFAPLAAKMKESLAQWEREKAAALAAGTPPDAAEFPPFPFGEKTRRPRCATLYNGMIAPFAGLRFRGVVWYQGEGNAGDEANGLAYRGQLGTLISAWRTHFADPDLPFYFVQLPAYREPDDAPAGGGGLALLRESQRQTLAVPHTGMAVTIDVGEAGDIHPRNKADVGDRLARLALHDLYGKSDVTPTGPLYRGMTVDGDQIRITFDHVGRGLMVAKKDGVGPAVDDAGGSLKRFAVAGADRKWVWATATIDGDAVIVSAPGVAAPVAVRYAFSANPAGANLYNRDGLPAAPFRTDDWPPAK
ncbi:MAG TPA: sialate O-acetylesterase [Tepidisphaeraceae bacterium]|nr:sialate O-acetylesterase [Tepidisphaeraceae bacterium]